MSTTVGKPLFLFNLRNLSTQPLSFFSFCYRCGDNSSPASPLSNHYFSAVGFLLQEKMYEGKFRRARTFSSTLGSAQLRMQ